MIYVGIGIAKVNDEVVYDENIANGANLRTDLKLGPNGYGGAIRDISILSGMGEVKGEPLTATFNC